MMMDCAPVKLQTLAVCSDGDVCQGIDRTQKSKVWVHSTFSLGLELVRPPGFEPGLRAWKARIITRLDYGRSRRESTVSGCDLRVLLKWTQLGGSVEGWNHILITSLATPVCAYRSVEGFYPDGRSQLPPVFDRSVEGYDPTVRISYSYHI